MELLSALLAGTQRDLHDVVCMRHVDKQSPTRVRPRGSSPFCVVQSEVLGQCLYCW